MSYCRWSSDDFKSDVYVYEDHRGFWAVHVAASRHARDNLPPGPGPLPHPDDGDEDFQRWADANRAFMASLGRAELVAIDLPYAGETFECQTPGEAAERLQELHDLGYHVPDGVIAELQEESRGGPETADRR